MKQSFAACVAPLGGALCISLFTSSASAQSASAAQQPANPALFDRMKQYTQPFPGVKIEFNYTSEVLGNVSGGYRRGAIYDALLKAGIEFNLEKICGWHSATLFANALYPHGASITQKYVHDLNVVSNIDAYDSVRLDEAWFEQRFFGDKFSIRLGELAADTEFLVCDSGALFFNSCFGQQPVVSLNFDTPGYPSSAPAVRLEWTPAESFLLRAGIYDGDIGTQDGNNKHGGRFAFNGDDGAHILVEAAYKTHAGADAVGLPGTFKLGGFCDTGKSENLDQSGRAERGIYGVYFIADQAIYREKCCCQKDEKNPAAASDQGLNVFTRFGVAGPDDRALVTSYIEGGLSYKGLLPGRDKDVCGLACSYTHISDEARDDFGAAVASHHETVIEATYQITLADWLTFQPDLQYVINPGATAETANATVIGARFMLNF